MTDPMQTRVKGEIRKLIADDSAISSIEYALILALIGAGLIAALGAFEGAVSTRFGEATTRLGG